MGEKQPKHVEPEHETSPLALASPVSKQTSPEEKTLNQDLSEKALVPIETPIFIAESIVSTSTNIIYCFLSLGIFLNFYVSCFEL